jgi:hypothetical protein
LVRVIKGVIEKYHYINIPKKKFHLDDEVDKNGRKGSVIPKPPDNKGGKVNSNAAANGKSRNSRSLSPLGASSARSQASWKVSTLEEVEAFKEDVLSIHVPSEDDDWMRFEMKQLTQFTRIFPVLPDKTVNSNSTNAMTEEEAAELEAKEEDDDDDKDDQEDENNVNVKSAVVVSKPKEPITIFSFNDILVEVLYLLFDAWKFCDLLLGIFA